MCCSMIVVKMILCDCTLFIKGELGVPAQLGKMKDIFYFDTTFFGIHTKLCKSLDSLTRQTMERSFEAIIDSGKYLNWIFDNLFKYNDEKIDCSNISTYKWVLLSEYICKSILGINTANFVLAPVNLMHVYVLLL